MKRRNKNPYRIMFSLYRRFIPKKRKAIIFMILQFFSRILGLISPYIFAQMINRIQLGGSNMMNELVPFFLIIISIPFVDWCLHGPARIMERQLKFDSVKAYKEYLYKCSIYLPIEWHTDHHTGETIDKITKATDALGRFAENIFSSLGTFVSLGGALIALTLIWPMLSLAVMLLGIVIISIVHIYDEKIIKLIQKYNKLDHKVNSLLVDYLSNIKTLITLRFLEPTEYALSGSIAKTYNIFNQQVKQNELKWFITDVLLRSSLGLILLIYIYYSRSVTGTVIIGTIMMIYQYVERVSNSFYNVTWSYSQITQSSANILAVEDIIKDYQLLGKQKDIININNRKSIVIKNLFFNYKEKKNILSNISFRMQRGEKIAFVGESGSGKSTLLSLLRGLYEVEKVEVNIDGKKYNKLSPLYNDTSLIPQEPEIFEESIAFNITMGLSVSKELIESYSRMARFHDIAIGLPHAYETNIKEKGVNLSGGQKQRLALARGLLVAEESSIILLDESTSSVDSINEKKIYTNVFNHFKDKTIIAAIHKLHLLTMFDTIYVFAEGKIIEYGSFHDLINQGGMLSHMWKEYQASQKKK